MRYRRTQCSSSTNARAGQIAARAVQPQGVLMVTRGSRDIVWLLILTTIGSLIGFGILGALMWWR